MKNAYLWCNMALLSLKLQSWQKAQNSRSTITFFPTFEQDNRFQANFSKLLTYTWLTESVEIINRTSNQKYIVV
jgi:hypothetical protein